MKEALQIICICIAVLYTYGFIKDLINKNKNLDAAIEWVNRGYCFGLGLLIVFVVFVLLIKLFSK
ncbi:hypothetical protein [Acinetobacter radioresistens]|uniref:hypothetical protein n=1 Tax=Acinetobacter radioresistens TaxID=40216 RepID=UPI003262D132